MTITNSNSNTKVQPKSQSKLDAHSAELKSKTRRRTKPTTDTITTTEKYENPWTYQGKEIYQSDLEGYQAFVYLITNIDTGQKYVGKKFIYSLRKEKGKTRRQRKVSDWQTYYGSNDYLKEQVKELGVTHLKREILHLCKTRAEANFREIEEQFLRRVLYSEDYINDNINGKWFSDNVKKYYL